MEVRFYDAGMLFIGPVDNATSVRWRRRYYEPGEFEIHMPSTEENIRLTGLDSYVWIRGKKECGIIEDRVITDSRESKAIAIKGRFASSIYDRRLIKETAYFSGTAEDAMMRIAKMVAPFPGVLLGEPIGYQERVSFQATYKNALAYLTKLSKYGNIGYRLRPDFTAKTLTFETYRGVDHSYSQNRNPRVMFSDSFNAMTNVTFSENNNLLKNVIYVGGQGEGADRIYVTCGDDSLSGFERREDFLSATDVTRDEGTSDAAYRSALAQRGNDALKERSASESIEGDVLPNSNYKYMADYDLGDVVTVLKPVWGIAKDARITEIEEVYEHGKMVVTPTLGDQTPEKMMDWSDK